MKKITLCVIGRDEEENLPTLLESVRPFVDEFCYTDTGSDDNSVKVAEEHGAKISYCTPKTHPQFYFGDGHISDFAGVRKFNFAQATGDWIIWLDCDDTLVGGEEIRKLVIEAEEADIDGYWLWYWYQLDKYGRPIEKHRKLQLVKNDGHFEWAGRIHEDILQRRAANWMVVPEKQARRLHRTKPGDAAAKYQRNLRILLDELKKTEANPDPRILFYVGRTFYALWQWEEAIGALEQYLERSGWTEERYEAQILLAHAYQQLKKPDDGIAVLMQAVVSRPEWPDAYYEMAKAYLRREDWAKAVEWCRMGFMKPIPDAAVTFFPLQYTSVPLGIYAMALLNLGKIEEGLEAAEQSLKYNPDDQNVEETRNACRLILKRKEAAKNFVKLAARLKELGEDKTKIPILLQAVPSDIAENPMVLKVKFDYLKPKMWAEDEIAIFCPATAEEWSPASQYTKGIGGSETAVIELAKRWQKTGWKVTVYNWCSAEDGEYEGVRWRNYWEFNWQDRFNILIVWRAPEIYDLDIRAKKRFLDLHDVMNTADFTPDRLNRIDKIFVKTRAHRQLYPEIQDEKFVIINNGIDLSRFELSADRKVERNPRKVVYSSSPNRGLDILLKLWPKVIEEIPDAELHLYYGWKTFYEIEKSNPERMAWMKKIQAATKQKGVIDHGRVDQKTLAHEFLSAGVWAYPTYFYEISCITAMEAQAAGAIPVVVEYAALRETIRHGIRIPGDAWDPNVQKKWLAELTKLLREPVRQDYIRRQMMAEAKEFSWDKVAKQWEKEFRT